MSKANGVPPAVGGLTARSLGYMTKREGDYLSFDFLVTLILFLIISFHIYLCNKPKLRRGFARHLLEHPRKMLGIIKPQVQGNL